MEEERNKNSHFFNPLIRIEEEVKQIKSLNRVKELNHSQEKDPFSLSFIVYPQNGPLNKKECCHTINLSKDYPFSPPEVQIKAYQNTLEEIQDMVEETSQNQFYKYKNEVLFNGVNKKWNVSITLVEMIGNIIQFLDSPNKKQEEENSAVEIEEPEKYIYELKCFLSQETLDKMKFPIFGFPINITKKEGKIDDISIIPEILSYGSYRYYVENKKECITPQNKSFNSWIPLRDKNDSSITQLFLLQWENFFDKQLDMDSIFQLFSLILEKLVKKISETSGKQQIQQIKIYFQIKNWFLVSYKFVQKKGNKIRQNNLEIEHFMKSDTKRNQTNFPDLYKIFLILGVSEYNLQDGILVNIYKEFLARQLQLIQQQQQKQQQQQDIQSKEEELGTIFSILKPQLMNFLTIVKLEQYINPLIEPQQNMNRYMYYYGRQQTETSIFKLPSQKARDFQQIHYQISTNVVNFQSFYTELGVLQDSNQKIQNKEEYSWDWYLKAIQVANKSKYTTDLKPQFQQEQESPFQLTNKTIFSMYNKQNLQRGNNLRYRSNIQLEECW